MRKSIFLLCLFFVGLSCQSQKTPVPDERIKTMIAFCEYLNKGDFSLNNPNLRNIFYFKMLEDEGKRIDSATYSLFIDMITTEKKYMGYINVKRVKVVSVYEVNDKIINNLGSSIKPDAYQLRYGRKRIYFSFEKNKIHSFRILNYGGQPIFWGVG